MKRRVSRKFKRRISQLTVFIVLGFMSLAIFLHYHQQVAPLAEQDPVATPKSGIGRQSSNNLIIPQENKPVLKNGDFHFVLDHTYVENDQLILEMTYHNFSNHPANPFNSFLFDFSQENSVVIFDLELNSSAIIDSDYQQMTPTNPRVKPDQSYPVYEVFDLMDLKDDVVISGRWIGSTVFRQIVQIQQLTHIHTASANTGKDEELSTQEMPLD